VSNDGASAPRGELLSLLDHFEGAFRAHLDLLHKYTAFYLTVIVAVLAATIAAITQAGPTPKVVALAPAAVCGLALLGWRVALVFYRRHIEAWMNVENILALLDLRISRYRSSGDYPDVFQVRFPAASSDDTFLVKWERPRAKPMLERGRSPDEVMTSLSRRSDVMLAVQVTFAIPGVIGVTLFSFIMFIE
jgi:hypothetical protein